MAEQDPQITAAQDAAAAAAKLQEDITPETAPDFENVAARTALEHLQREPNHEQLAAFFNALREGYLVVDVTGTTTKKKGTRVRTIKSTSGKMVLPIFTSMRELRAAVRKGEPQGAIMPAREALALINSGPLVAIEVDPASRKQVVLRRFVQLLLSDAEITAASLQQL